MIRIDFSAKAATESTTLTFDFSGELATGEAIVNAGISIAVYSGGDFFPDNVLVGNAAINGPVVTQEVTGGVVGVTYVIDCSVSTSIQNTYTAEGLLTINGRITSAVATVPGTFESQSTAANAAKAAAVSASEADSAATTALACAFYRSVNSLAFANSPYIPGVDKSGTLFIVNTVAGGVTINLPQIGALQLPFTLGLKLGDAPHSVVINSDAADNIDGLPTNPLTLTVLGNGFHLVATSTGWYSVPFGLGGGNSSGNFSTNTNLSADGEVVVFSGAGGHTGRRATGTGVALLTAGVLSIATAGVDYPNATSGTALQKGNGTGGLTAATAGVDYYATGGDLGTPSAGVLTNCTFPTLNQNTTGSAAKWTTARNLAGNSTDGSANVAFANKFIVQGLTDTGLSAAQFLGSLATGIVKNTTNTGVLSIAAAGTDYVAPSGALGTPTSGVLTNCTGTASGLTAGGVTGLVVTSGKTLTINNSVTMAGNDGASLNVGAGGTLGGAAFTTFPDQTSNSGKVLTTNGTVMSWGTLGAGTVTTLSVVSANGFTGSVATATSTPAITLTTSITGVLKGNGTAISAASAGTDYVAPSGALGTPSSGTLTSCTGLPISTGVSGLGTTVATNLALAADGSSASAIGFRGLPQNSKSAAYTTVMADSGGHILHPAADTTARTFTIDSNANVAYPIGTAITIINEHSGGVITIAITSDTMRLAGAGTTGSRTLAADGIATAVKITSTSWIISGTGLT